MPTPPTPPETRVVLVKPGDVLVFGNVALTRASAVEAGHAAGRLKELLGLSAVLFFADDVTLAVNPPEKD